MAYFRKTKTGYTAEIQIKGVRKSKSFTTKREAQIWAASQETDINQGATTPPQSRYTLRYALEKYRDEITGRNAGARWEQVRINLFLNHQDLLPLNKKIGEVTTEDFSHFRNLRLQKVKPGTVLREFGILSAIMEVVRKEWKWIKDNPVIDVKKPPKPIARDRLITRSEIKSMLRGLDYSPTALKITSVTQSIAVCFLLALRTGMRAGDMTGLQWKNVNPRYLTIEVDKVGRKKGLGRTVPLSKKAVRILQKMQGYDKVSVFALRPQTLDARFRTIRERQGLSGFTFHDTRHTAATWMAGKFKSSKEITAQQAIFDMCKIFGWKDPKRALDYYNPDPEDVASRLD